MVVCERCFFLSSLCVNTWHRPLLVEWQKQPAQPDVCRWLQLCFTRRKKSCCPLAGSVVLRWVALGAVSAENPITHAERRREMGRTSGARGKDYRVLGAKTSKTASETCRAYKFRPSGGRLQAALHHRAVQAAGRSACVVVVGLWMEFAAAGIRFSLSV